MKEKIVKTNIIYALLYILVPVLLCALGLLITYFFFHDGGSGAVIFTMGPFLISAIWLIFGGGSIFKQEIKKFEAKLASDGFKRNQTFYGKGKYVAIDLEKGEIALEQAVELYSQGIKISADCRKELENAKLKITEEK